MFSFEVDAYGLFAVHKLTLAGTIPVTRPSNVSHPANFEWGSSFPFSGRKLGGNSALDLTFTGPNVLSSRAVNTKSRRLYETVFLVAFHRVA